MSIHEFILILEREPSDADVDRLYGLFDDGTIATLVGVPQVMFHREATTLEEAIQTAIRDVREAELEVVRVEMEPTPLARSA